MYVLDTGVISNLHKNYYRKRFVSLWKEFDQLVADGKITSTREVFHDLGDGSPGADLDWAKANATIFATPDAKEGAFVAKIYAVAHFQANIEKQKIYKGGRNADAFVVARAYAIGGVVVIRCTGLRTSSASQVVGTRCRRIAPGRVHRIAHA